MKLEGNTNKLVSYSRAGDVFHYRWAARRCLKLIQPKSNMVKVVIERSLAQEKAGEDVIDVSEYYEVADLKSRIEYYQLKHTSVQQNKPFTLSGLKDTVIGFSKRYQQHVKEKSLNGVSFTVITNRKVDETFKQNLVAIIEGNNVNRKFIQTLKSYTNLDGKELIAFCKLLNLDDSEGNYNIQKEQLRTEMALFQPGSIDTTQVANIVSLVQEKVLPDSNGEINKEEVLKRFGVTSEKQLFPAPPLFEELDKITIRDQYHTLLENITNSEHPQIINAEGGVGKSVFSQYILNALPNGSLGIAYDCFGSGKYRSRSEPRHKHRDALVQIINELASIGLCERILVKDTTQESDIMRDFLSRIEITIKSLKKSVSSAKLFIIIDAADNSEMAANEFGDSCFANELLREQFPKDCKLVLLCRPERTHLLKPSSFIEILNLQPFSKEETFENLKKWFPEVNLSESLEFHRLTNGNPRVQMNSIIAANSSVNELLIYLGPSGVTVEKQIEQQLNYAVKKIKDTLPEDYQTIINKICTGLASLPPNIPIHVLAKASGVKIEDVKSFVSDIGRSLWLLDSSVQFRDEPTETWFRNTFLGSEHEFSSYIEILEPLAIEFTYVAEVLPQLYLQAGQYDQLISIALSDTLLPINNPIDTRNVMVYRLQFAFKAALRSEKYEDAIKLAFRAGEEVAGDQRQQKLFQNNIDLLPKLQDNLKVQEIAFKGTIKSGWEGSENVYAASLLSEIEEYKGEASGYLRSALNWLDMYFKAPKEESLREQTNEVTSDDIIEIALVHLNLKGARLCLKFLNSLKPKEAIFPIMKRLISRLIDAGRFDEINEILKYARKNKYHVIAIVSELVKVGRFAQAIDIKRCFILLSQPKTRIKKPSSSYHDNITSSIVTFLEACLNKKMNTKLILDILDYYVPDKASRGVGTRFTKERTVFLKALSIRKVISKKFTFNLDRLMPDEYRSEDKERNHSNEIRDFKEIVGGLYPWFLLRAQLISGDNIDLNERTKQTSRNSKKACANRYRSHDDFPNEIADVSSSILVYYNKEKAEEVEWYYNNYISNNSSFKIHQRINLLRVGNRSSHLDSILTELEDSTYQLIKRMKDVGPEEIADHYILLARAVLTSSKDDATIYFEEAINIVSKFGDEIVQRWEAVAALGERAAPEPSDELAYRFIRCTELVGEYVYREKHWNRSGALITCAKMSPQIAISALSRWRDREIGRFEYQLESLLDYLVRSKTINPAEGWAMARFLSDHYSNQFLITCLKNESSSSLREEIFIDAYELLRKEGAGSSHWLQMKSIADEHEIIVKDLNDVVSFYQEETKKPKNSKIISTEKTPTKEIKKWDSIFQEVDILSQEGLANLIDRFSNEFIEVRNYQHLRLLHLYKEILNRIKVNEIYLFIDILFSSDKLNDYECKEVLKSIPINWKNKVSFKKRWPSIIYRFGIRYSHDLVNSYSFNSVVKDLNIDNSLAIDLRKGIFKGLSQGQEFAEATILFGFIEHASTFIKSSDSCDLVDYALSRFELHIEDDFGDGLWDKWLHLSNDISRNIAGFIWSALGSPHSKTRWSGCHVVKKLADFNCILALNSLLDWLKHNNVDAFGSNQYPFYNLHARQYLLIALRRVSVDQPSLLIANKEVFVNYAQLEPHVLIQKFSADIALNIEKAIPETYSKSKTSLLKEIGKSKQQTRNEEYGYKVNSYLHERGLIDTSLDYNFGWDFDRYWYEPLGNVFGVSGKQIQDICANVIIHDWKQETEGGYNNDPRVNLWNSSQDRQTSHDHGSYPKTDNLDFYLSYHSMLVTAAKLVENMQIIVTKDWYDENAWEDWLSRHMLTKSDSKWLADNRDSLPLVRPKWLTQSNYENWRKDIKEIDFLNSIKVQTNNETWLNIKGGWTERHDSRYETYSISTALVSKEASGSLLRALSTCSNSHDYKIPDYEESRMEINADIFRLDGFIVNSDSSKGIDEFDPYGENIMYPQFSLSEEILKKLKLLSDSEGKTWYSSNGQVALKCDTWSSNLEGYDKEPEQSGMRLSASLDTLKKICQIYDCNLIIDVNISRNIEYRSRSNKDKYEYITNHKIYLLSEDGRLKSTTENYRIR
jgi:hypothetical protein